MNLSAHVDVCGGVRTSHSAAGESAPRAISQHSPGEEAPEARAMGPLRRAAARGGRALMMIAMAPVASTSNIVAMGVGTQSWGVLAPRDSATDAPAASTRAVRRVDGLARRLLLRHPARPSRWATRRPAARPVTTPATSSPPKPPPKPKPPPPPGAPTRSLLHPGPQGPRARQATGMYIGTPAPRACTTWCGSVGQRRGRGPGGTRVCNHRHRGG